MYRIVEIEAERFWILQRQDWDERVRKLINKATVSIFNVLIKI